MTLPVSFARLPRAVGSLLESSPDVLLLVGESSEAHELRVERWAVNLAHARIPDNDGSQPRDLALAPGAPLVIPVGFAVPALVSAIEGAGVPATASAHAGTFCCNAALYLALQAVQSTKVAFIHVPAKRRHLRAKVAALGLRAALAHLASHTI